MAHGSGRSQAVCGIENSEAGSRRDGARRARVWIPLRYRGKLLMCFKLGNYITEFKF